MKSALLWFALVAFFCSVSAKSGYFSDVSDEYYKNWLEMAKFFRGIEADAAEEVPEIEPDPEVETQSQSSKNEPKPPFEYNFPTVNSNNEDSHPFAVSPFDPRYYRNLEAVNGALDKVETTKEKRPRAENSREAPGEDDPTHSFVRQVPVTGVYDDQGRADIYFTAIVAGCSAAAVVAVIAIGIGCYRLQKNAKAAADVDYPAYGVTGPNKDVSPTSGDRRLAQSAQMYHYQHQKQQIIAMESMNNRERRNSVSDAESEEENEEGDYTVYECPGLAPTGEMEVKNPLFQDDQTPASKPTNDSTEEPRELPK